MLTRELMQQALEALVTAEAGLADIGDADREPTDDLAWCEERAAQALAKPRAAIVALKAALANELFGNSEQLVMRPEREWVGLTDEEIGLVSDERFVGALWAQARLKEKNT
jgi:hypothetical protein